MSDRQLRLSGEEPFATGSPANPIYCHQDFLEKMHAQREQPVGKRASLLLQRLAVDERRLHFKATQGENRGWRRSRLGGNHGSHFYAWWAPKSAPPFRGLDAFENAPEGSIFVRDLRHHDDHSPATPQTVENHYLPVSVEDLRRDEYGPSPWTLNQAKFAGARQTVRILKGHPGSGKTTALLHAADETSSDRILYLTFSHHLAALARTYFDRYCAKDRTYQVLTFRSFLGQLVGTELDPAASVEGRKSLRAELHSFARSLGAWNDHKNAFYDELHAHLIGGALPVKVGRFEGSKIPRVPDKSYAPRRTYFLGHGAAAAVMDVASRLERMDRRTLAERFFPELQAAWRAAEALVQGSGFNKEFLEFDCVAVDECQDLTPLEAFVVIRLAAMIRTRQRSAPLLLAGDEAQTVRPTDFEWAWMNDMLHNLVGTPSEFKLSTNLRSPQRIANLVNHVWDLYARIEKRDRPSGTGYAEIEDDATDQVLYCTAVPGVDLTALLENLKTREGLAMVAMDEETISSLPESVRSAVLTPEEIKGLDFHSVCVLNPGRLLHKIVKDHPGLPNDLDSLRTRLSIDALRVALSRPTERLIWLDVLPNPETIRQSLEFLGYRMLAGTVAPSVPSSVLKTLEEESLDLEERIQRCTEDARQFLQVRPDLALSRAFQAVSLLGQIDSPAAVRDEAFRREINHTAAEVCFCIAFRKQRLGSEMGGRNLFLEARQAAQRANQPGLAHFILAIHAMETFPPSDRLRGVLHVAQAVIEHDGKMPAWLMVETADQMRKWVEELEDGMAIADNAVILSDVLPKLYDALKLTDAEERKQRVSERSIDLLVRNRQYEAALQLLERKSERDYVLEAVCFEGLGRLREAAEAFRQTGNSKDAIRCYRSIPDFDGALSVMRELKDHPAAESYEWVARLRDVIKDKPEKFNRVMQASEKQVLEQLLEQALGVVRKKPAAKKTAGKTSATKKAPAPKAGTPARRTRRPPINDDPHF